MRLRWMNREISIGCRWMRPEQAAAGPLIMFCLAYGRGWRLPGSRRGLTRSRRGSLRGFSPGNSQSAILSSP